VPPNQGAVRWMAEHDLCLVLFAVNLLLCVLLAADSAMQTAHQAPPSASTIMDWYYLLWLTPYTACFLFCAWNFAQPVPRWWITLIPSLIMIPDGVFAAVAYGNGGLSEGRDLTILFTLILLTPPKIVLAVLFAKAAWRQFKQWQGRETSPTNPTGQIT
jgi:hypothetical protein